MATASNLPAVGQLVGDFLEIEVIRGSLKPLALWVGGDTDTGYAADINTSNRLLSSDFPTALTVAWRLRLSAEYLEGLFPKRHAGVVADEEEEPAEKRHARYINNALHGWGKMNRAIQKICNEYFGGHRKDLSEAVKLATIVNIEDRFEAIVSDEEKYMDGDQMLERRRRQYEERHILHEFEYSAQIREHYLGKKLYPLPGESTFPLPVESPVDDEDVDASDRQYYEAIVIRTPQSNPLIILLQNTSREHKDAMRYAVESLSGTPAAIYALGSTIWHQLAIAHLLILNFNSPVLLSQLDNLVTPKTLDDYKRYVYSVVPDALNKRLPPFVDVPLANYPTSKQNQDYWIFDLFLQVLGKQYETQFPGKRFDVCFDKLFVDITAESEFETLPREFFERVAICKKRFVVAMLPLPRHANALVIDTKRNLVFRFEPNADMPSAGYVDRWARNIFVPALVAATGNDDYRYENPTTLCPNLAGVQVLEGKTSTGEAGFCVAWSAMFLSLLLLNPGWSLVEIQERMFQAGRRQPVPPKERPAALSNYVRRFVAAMDCYIPPLSEELRTTAIITRDYLLRKTWSIPQPCGNPLSEVGFVTDVFVNATNQVFAMKSFCGFIYVTSGKVPMIKLTEKQFDALPLQSVVTVDNQFAIVSDLKRRQPNRVVDVSQQGQLSESYMDSFVDFLVRPQLLASYRPPRHSDCPRLVVERG